MPQNINELIDGTVQLGEKALPNESDEYTKRLYCNRCYYTLYHATIEYLDKQHDYKNVVATSAYANMGSHNQVTKFLDEHIHIPKLNTHREYKSLVYRLKALKQLRVKADYFLDKTIEDIDCIQANNQFNNTLDLIKKLK